MESERFDRLVWTFGQPRSRRLALRGIAGAAAAALALGGRRASAARCKADGAGCKNRHQCCSNICLGETKSTRTCTARTAEVCGNNLDDDGNSLVDCNDPACAGHPSCPQPQPEICNNGGDDDLDGSVDKADPDCHGV
jgi:hypothetical protein